jgi:photosystem II stability/assembly factor-like uncharacterized protein
MHMLVRLRGVAWTACLAVLALVLIAASSAGVNSPQSGWYSGNPLLGPNSLLDLECAGNTCYAAGTFGTLLKSTDGGASWAGIVTGLTVDLRFVRIGDSPEQVIVGGGCSLRRSDDGGDTFRRLPFSASDRTCPVQLSSFDFPSANVGYLVFANQSVLATTDGGRTFSRRTSLGSAAASDLVCVSNTTCFASTGGAIQRTTDGAVSWTPVATVSTQLNDLEAVDATTLYAAGSGQTLLRSVDGGAIWTRRPLAGVTQTDLASVRCGSAEMCLASTIQRSRVIRTADAGETGTSVVPSTDPTYAVEFASLTRALAVGGLGSAEISNDAGAAWVAVGTRIAGSLVVLEAASGDVAYAGGLEGVLTRTADGGQTWANVSPPTSSTIEAVSAPSAARVFVQAAGALHRSDNGGESYRLLDAGPQFVPRDIAAPTPELVIAVGFRGIRRSIDGGETFAAVSDRDLRGANLTQADVAGSALVAHGRSRLLVSVNRGLSWRRVRLPRRIAIHDVSFVSSGVGYVLDVRGNVWRTANGGRRWKKLESLGRVASQIEFSDARQGHAVVGGFAGSSGGFVLRTSDAGRSWRPQIVSPSPVNALAAAGGTSYALAGNGFLYATRTGGDVGSARALSLTTRGRVLARVGTAIVRGRLASTSGAEQAVVSMLSRGRWTSKAVPVAASGSFSASFRVRGRTVFVAQALGNADFAGAGTRPLTVAVRVRR